MNNLITRTIYGFIFAVVVIGSILTSVYIFALLMLAVSVIGTFEMNRLLGNNPKNQSDLLQSWLVSLSAYVIIALHAMDLIASTYLLLLIFPLFSPFLFSLFSVNHTFSNLAPKQFASIVLVAVPSGLTLYFYNKQIVGETAGSLLLLSVIGMVWVNDIFAYLVGSRFGKTRLFERISPKKSWEGSIGGFVFTLCGAALYADLSGLLVMNQALAIATIVVVFGSLGDLIESMLKRQAGVKDSGNLIPGHGGILDRFDATFFAVPFVFVYLIIAQ